jgi:trigger factor
MQVSVETTSSLSRKMTVQVPEEVIQEKVSQKLQSYSKSVRVDGFRPGKVPARVIKSKFGADARNDVISELLQSSFYEALTQEKLNPAGMPKIDPAEKGEGEGLEFVATFEVYPEISIKPLEELSLSQQVSSVTDQDLDEMIERLRDQKKNWKEIDRASKSDDQVTITFEGKLGGESFTDGKVEDFDVEIGSGKMIPGFEEKLLGHKAGEELSFDIEFPEDYGNEKLSGKTAQFEVAISKVAEKELPEVDAEFAKSFGVEDGDLEKFRTDIRGNMERELKQAVKNKVKGHVMDSLLEENPVELPVALIDQEIERMLAPYKEAAQKQGKSEADMPREMFEDQAKKRVGLGLLLSEVVKTNELSVDKDKVQETIKEMAQSYDEPEEVINWYNSNPEQLGQIESMVLEDMLVDFVLDKAKVTEEKVAFTEIVKPEQDQ